jgi:CRP-like cAMP-binding protein/thioredoxin reductase/Fe-S-cluster-containing hydrogenase component 2
MAEQIYKVVIVGAGPGGLSAAARAQANHMEYLLFDKGELANTLYEDYQYGKFVQAFPSTIPARSDLSFQAGSREEILAGWNTYANEQHLNLHKQEAVTAVTRQDGCFEVKTAATTYRASNVILAIGKLGNPRHLTIPGAESEHVEYRLKDPRAYTGKDILVVGDGDSAAEVALALAERNRVTIFTRRTGFFRMNDALQSQINQKIESKELTAYYSADLQRIEPDVAYLLVGDHEVPVKAQHIFVKIGAEMPRGFLEQCGVTFASQDPEALPLLDAHYQSVVPGMFLVGSVGGKDLIKYGLNQGYEVIEHLMGHEVEPADEPRLREVLQLIPGDSVTAKLALIQSRVPFLAEVSSAQLREFALLSTVHEFRQDEVVFEEGKFDTTFFTLVEGTVGLSFKAEATRRIELHQGEFFGEMSLISDRPRGATVTAMHRVLAIETPRRAMLKLMKAESSVKTFIDKVYILRALQSNLCPELTSEEFHQSITDATLKPYKKDEIIFKAGDDEDGFYLIRSGTVKIIKKRADGQEYIVTFLHVGSYFGEIALLTEGTGKRNATVMAATNVELIHLAKQAFLELLRNHPSLRENMQRQAQQRNLEAVIILEAPKQVNRMTDFRGHGVVEGTDVLLIDETKCIRCNNCVTACAATHNGQTRLERASGPSFAHVHVPVSCRHCEGAPCLQDCPPGDAIVRDADGVVQIFADKCIGCGNCARFCPYKVIFMVEPPKPKTSWSFTHIIDLLRPKKEADGHTQGHRTIAVKCDLCFDLEGGPACVRSCPTGAAIRVKPDFFKTVEFHDHA